MNFDGLVELFRLQPWFDLSSVVTLSGSTRESLLTNLYRWKKQGKIIELRRGMYALSDRYRLAMLHGPLVANGLYVPSYLTGLWALSWLGIIPERVVTFTSVTTRVTRSFSNAFGNFEYRTVKTALFFGQSAQRLQGVDVMLAGPEKALLDFWYLEKGEWTSSRMEAMRFTVVEDFDIETLEKHAVRSGEPRLSRAVSAWKSYSRAFRSGWVKP